MYMYICIYIYISISHVDRRVDLAVLQRAVDVDLPLGDVSRQVGDRVGDVVVGHRQNRELRDGAAAPLRKRKQTRGFTLKRKERRLTRGMATT